jgi:hypothetical protein
MALMASAARMPVWTPVSPYALISEIRETDGDNQEGCEPLPQRDDEGL